MRDENKDEENKTDEDKNWIDITNKLNDSPFNKQHKKILEKLDEEDTYAILHHIVFFQTSYVFLNS